MLRAAPGARDLVDLTQAELGEGLRLRAHPSEVNPSFRMPLVPLLEADAFVRLGTAGSAAAFAALYALTVLLVYALGFASGGEWGGLAAAGTWEALFATQARAPGFAKQFVLTPLVVLAARMIASRPRRFLTAVAARLRFALGLEPALIAFACLGLLLRLRDPAALSAAAPRPSSTTRPGADETR